MRLKRKAYVRTLEAFIAFFMTFTFLIFIVATKETALDPEKPQIYILRNFEQRPDFRECIYTNNITCVESMIDDSIPAAYDYQVTINDPSYKREKNIFIDTLYITGSTASNQYTIRMYYWKK